MNHSSEKKVEAFACWNILTVSCRKRQRYRVPGISVLPQFWRRICRKFSYFVSCWELIVARISLACVKGVRKGRGIPFKRLPGRLELAFQADLLRAPAPRIPVGGSARIADSHRYFTPSSVPNSQKNEGTLVGHNPSRSFLKLLWPGGEGDTVWSQKNFSASRTLESINLLSK